MPSAKAVEAYRWRSECGMNSDGSPAFAARWKSS
jgi:hypothetical protein